VSCPRRRADTPLSRSIKDRLRNKAEEQRRPFNDLLQQYIIERFLYRLSVSGYQDHFVLKGALMLVARGGASLRPTRDVDLLGYVSNQPKHVRRIIQEICDLPGENEDAVWLDPGSVTVSPITTQSRYSGMRVRLITYLGKACVPLQIDIGFGDVLTDQPRRLSFPLVLAGLPAARIVGYPVEAIIAEKVETMIRLGSANSRMKDFFDVWMLIGREVDCTPALARALEATLHHRGTPVPNSVPIAWTAAFAVQKERDWKAFLRRSRLQAPSLQAVVQRLQEALWPCIQKTHRPEQ